MSRLNLNALLMFDVTARHLNFRLAAQELNLTQGAVAQQVRKLEADLGIQLFHRKARGLALTDIGRSYHLSVKRALEIIDDATRKLRPQNTHVTLSITPSFASKWLVPRLAAFTRAYPNIEVQTVASEGLANFQSDGIDLAIRQGSPPFDDGLDVELLAPLDLCAVCSPDFAQGLDTIRKLEDFASLHLIQDSHNLWDVLFEDAGIKAQYRMVQFNQTTLAVDAAANGQGITLAPKILVNSEIERGRLVELWRDNRADQGGYYIVYPRNRKSSSARDALIKWVLFEVSHN